MLHKIQGNKKHVVMDKEFFIKLWGVRGTVPVTGDEYSRYGGNTSCVEVRCGGRQIIFDAGTGIRELGRANNTCHVDILLSHTHLDHIQGLPFFRPLHAEGSNVALWAGHLLPKNTVKNVVSTIMKPPVFPLTLEDVHSRVEFNDFMAGEPLQNEGLKKAGVTVKTIALNHPDGATGYRVEYEGKSMCYITDIEHIPGTINIELVEFLRDADVFLYDSTFDDEEWLKYKGWGHSTWQEAVRLGEAAKVKKIIAYHHNPDCNDEVLDKRAIAIKAMCPRAELAVEGMEIKLI